MSMGVLPPGLSKAHVLERVETICPRLKLRMLPREDDRRRHAQLGECDRDGLHLYRFGPGTDDQPYVGETQSSP